MDTLTVVLVIGALALLVSIVFRIRNLLPEVRTAIEKIVEAFRGRRGE